MKIILDIPETITCSIFNFTMVDGSGTRMGARLIDNDELKDNNTIKVDPNGGKE